MSGLDPLYYNDSFRLLFHHKLGWWLAWLRGMSFGHCFAALTRLYRDQKKSGPSFAYVKALDRWLVLLAFADWVSWWFVFRDTHRFLRFHRPTKGYRWAVYIISATTTIPSFILHIQIISLNNKIKSLFGLALIVCVLPLFQFLAASGLYLWMVHRFLLREDEEHYEPITHLLGNCTASTSSSRGLSLSVAAALEPYSDSSTPPSSSHESHLSSNSHLSKAYIMQGESARLPAYELDEEDHGQGSEVTGAEHTPNSRNASSSNLSESTTSGPTDNQPASPLRCRTVARFDYMCQDRIGPHSWLSYHLIPVILGTISTVLFGLVAILVFEDSLLADPSPKAKCGLRAPLGGYLFCAYAIKRELRKSLFSRSHTPLPEPWVETRSLVGKPVFINSDTRVSTKVDPRLRAFPIKRQDYRAGIRSSQYMEAYSAGQSTCKEYWGHLGRVWTTQSRGAPTMFILSFIGFASFQFVEGYKCVSSYPLERVYRMMTVWIILLFSSFILVVFIVLYAFCSVISVLSLLGSSSRAWKRTGSPNAI